MISSFPNMNTVYRKVTDYIDSILNCLQGIKQIYAPLETNFIVNYLFYFVLFSMFVTGTSLWYGGVSRIVNIFNFQQ